MDETDSVNRDQLAVVLYDELHRAAVLMMRRQRPGHTLQPSALVHETLTRLLAAGTLDPTAERGRLYAAAVQAMRSVLTDHHRRRASAKRGAAWQRHPLDAVIDHFEARERLRFIDLEEALQELGRLEPRQALVVSFRYFLGMSAPEAAEALGVSTWTVEADWRLARAWLRARLGEGSTA
jgi:RNA polymerase sigma-70 factor (ECF subfamily)